jgi:hypothetical protein
VHEGLHDAELLTVPLRELSDRAVEVDPEALAELLSESDLGPAAQTRERLELFASGEPVRYPTPRRASTPSLCVSSPKRAARPAVGRISPSRRRIVVDLPAPFGPR